MNERRVALLAMRVFGLYVAFRGLFDLLRGTEFILRSSGLDSFLSSGIISGVLLVAVGAVVWMNAEALAARALGEGAPGPDVRVDVTALDVNSVAFTVLGVYLVAIGLGQSAGAVGQWIQVVRSSTARGFPDAMPGFAQSLIYAGGTYVVVGLMLAFGARGLASMFRRAWWRGRGVVRASRFELIDVSETVRAQLAVEETEAREDVGLTFFDEDDRARLRAGIRDGGAPEIVLLDASGADIQRLPATSDQSSSETS